MTWTREYATTNRGDLILRDFQSYENTGGNYFFRTSMDWLTETAIAQRFTPDDEQNGLASPVNLTPDEIPPQSYVQTLTFTYWPVGGGAPASPFNFAYRMVTNSDNGPWRGYGDGAYGLTRVLGRQETSGVEFMLEVGDDSDNGTNEQSVIVYLTAAISIDFVPDPGPFYLPGQKMEAYSAIPLAGLAINGEPVDGNGAVVITTNKGIRLPIAVTSTNTPNKAINATAATPDRIHLTYACHPNFSAPDAVSNKLQSVRIKLRSGAQTVFHNDYLQEVYRDTDPRVQPDPIVPLYLQRTNLYRLDDVPVYLEFIVKPSWDQEPAQDPADPPVVLVGRFPSSLAAPKFFNVASPEDVQALFAWPAAHVKEVSTIAFFDPTTGMVQSYSGYADIGCYTFLITSALNHEGICHEFGHASGLAHRGVRWAYQLQPDGSGTFFREEDETLPDVAGMYYVYPNPGKDPNALMRAGGGGAPMGKVNRYERGIILNSIGGWNSTGVSGPPQ